MAEPARESPPSPPACHLRQEIRQPRSLSPAASFGLLLPRRSSPVPITSILKQRWRWRGKEVKGMTRGGVSTHRSQITADTDSKFHRVVMPPCRTILYLYRSAIKYFYSINFLLHVMRQRSGAARRHLGGSTWLTVSLCSAEVGLQLPGRENGSQLFTGLSDIWRLGPLQIRGRANRLLGVRKEPASAHLAHSPRRTRGKIH